jgi:DNA-binding MarR family transcriptional regulator
MATEPADSRRTAWDALVRAQALVLPQVHRLLRGSHGLSLSEFIVLKCIGATGTATMTELQEQASLSAAGITRVVSGLVAQGMVLRTRGEQDLRLWHAQVTPAGRRRLSAASATLDQELGRLFGGQHNEDELAVAARVLQNLCNAVP